MKTVTLHGAKAAGRVALVDDEDYQLVSHFHWFLWEMKRVSGSISGPYAHAMVHVDGEKVKLSLHRLVTGYPQTDHMDQDGLNNQRSNLRPATTRQNVANKAGYGGTSSFKGVYWAKDRGKWVAVIRVAPRSRKLGCFTNEIDAARAYDAAAIKVWGDYAYLNFPVAPDPATAAATRVAERAAYEAERQAYQSQALAHLPVSATEWWSCRAPEPHTCTVCGAAYFSRSQNASYYCSARCNDKARWRRRRKAKEAAA